MDHEEEESDGDDDDAEGPLLDDVSSGEEEDEDDEKKREDRRGLELSSRTASNFRPATAVSRAPMPPNAISDEEKGGSDGGK